jgi:hypothetical protein
MTLNFSEKYDIIVTKRCAGNNKKFVKWLVVIYFEFFYEAPPLITADPQRLERGAGSP